MCEETKDPRALESCHDDGRLYPFERLQPGAGRTPAAASQPADSSLRELDSQVRELRAVIEQMRTENAQSRAEMRELRQELQDTRKLLAPLAAAANVGPAASVPAQSVASVSSQSI